MIQTSLLIVLCLTLNAQDGKIVKEFEDLYQEGNLEELVKLEGFLVTTGFQFSISGTKLEKTEVVEAWRFITMSYILLRDKLSAERAMYAMLSLDLKFKPDPLRDPPEFISLFNEFDVGRNIIGFKRIKRKETESP